MSAHGSTTVLGLVIPSSNAIFLGIVGLHVLLGLGCVLFGLFAMLAAKGRGRHATLGIAYFWCMSGLFATMAALSFLRWPEDNALFLLGALAFALVVLGRQAARRGLGLRTHASCMSASYIVVLTAFYVDNGKSLPLWRDLPTVAYWTIPAMIGVPLILWTLARHPLLRGASR